MHAGFHWNYATAAGLAILRRRTGGGPAIQAGGMRLPIRGVIVLGCLIR